MERGFGGIGLEVIGSCNAACEFCSLGTNVDIKSENVHTGEIITRSKGKKISIDLIDSILAEHPIQSIICTGLSEPFLAPDRVLYLAEKSNELDFKLNTYTNGTLLTEDVSKRLLTYKNFKSINFSLNAATDETRLKVMGLSLKEAEENVINFLEIRKSLHREDVNVGNVMMLTPTNRHEEPEFRKKWNNIFNKYGNCQEPGVFYATNWNGEVDNYWMTSEGDVSGCGQWECDSPTISVDGQIYLCCYSSKYTFGHCLDQEAVTSWLDRKEHYGVVSKETKTYPSLCADCSHRFSNYWER